MTATLTFIAALDAPVIMHANAHYIIGFDIETPFVRDAEQDSAVPDGARLVRPNTEMTVFRLGRQPHGYVHVHTNQH
jgi:hypothetical protein